MTVIAVALTACSNISEDERLVYVPPVVDPHAAEVIDDDDPVAIDSVYDAPVAEVPQRVLIEDHTGQECPNCPDATNMIHEFQQTYGSLIVPVAIHSRAQGIMEPEGLGTELGNTYYNRWGLSYKPAGLVNRMDGGGSRVLDKTIWPMAVQYALTMNTAFDVRVRAVLDASDATKAHVDVKVLATRDDASFSGNLQVWVTEDNIVAMQDSMGVRKPNYVHNHVLRGAVNGDSGEPLSLNGTGDQKEFHYELPLKAGWNAAHLSIVAFIYNDNQVEQVVSRAVMRGSNQ